MWISTCFFHDLTGEKESQNSIHLPFPLHGIFSRRPRISPSADRLKCTLSETTYTAFHSGFPWQMFLPANMEPFINVRRKEWDPKNLTFSFTTIAENITMIINSNYHCINMLATGSFQCKTDRMSYLPNSKQKTSRLLTLSFQKHHSFYLNYFR